MKKRGIILITVLLLVILLVLLGMLLVATEPASLWGLDFMKERRRFPPLRAEWNMRWLDWKATVTGGTTAPG